MWQVGPMESRKFIFYLFAPKFMYQTESRLAQWVENRILLTVNIIKGLKKHLGHTTHRHSKRQCWQVSTRIKINEINNHAT